MIQLAQTLDGYAWMMDGIFTHIGLVEKVSM